MGEFRKTFLFPHLILFHRTNIPYLVWKNNNIVLHSTIVMREVNEDGYTFEENSPTFELMAADYLTDINVVEGPTISK